MPLVDQPFADTFAFSRARASAYVDAAGDPAEAAVDVPRFDHALDGTPRGLLIEGRPQFGAADRLTVVDGDWAQPGGTVLHEYETPAGEVRRRAIYAPDDPSSAVDGCLNAKGRHRRIAYVPGFLKNRGGRVRWRDLLWDLPGLVFAEAGVALTPITDKPLLEG